MWEDEGHSLSTDLMAEVFVEQSLALPRSANESILMYPQVHLMRSRSRKAADMEFVTGITGMPV